MNRPRSNRRRTGSLLLAMVGVLAAVGALAGFAAAKDGGHRAEKRHGHHGRHRSHSPSGTIQAFDASAGKLTIALTDGETVSGLVTSRTKIRCEDEHAPDRTQLRHGESEPGDDNGGHGEEEPGDDHGGNSSGPGPSDSSRGPSGHDDNGRGANCTVSDLIVGATVDKAELEIEHGTVFFDEVELDD